MAHLLSKSINACQSVLQKTHVVMIWVVQIGGVDERPLNQVRV